MDYFDIYVQYSSTDRILHVEFILTFAKSFLVVLDIRKLIFINFHSSSTL